MSRGAPSLESIRSVLVVKPSSLGDIVHTLPSVHLLKRAHPHLKINWVVNNEGSPLLAGNPDLDGIILFPRKNFRGLPNPYKMRDWICKAGAAKPDLALDFQGLLRSALIARISGARQHSLPSRCARLACRLLGASRGARHPRRGTRRARAA